MNNILRFAIVFLLCSAALGADDAIPWPQWRGPTRDGLVAPADALWPAKIGESNLSLKWRKSLAWSYASPIITKDLVISVESLDGKEIVRAFDRATGKPLWDTPWEGAMTVPFFAGKNGNWVRCTPACDGASVYVGGMRDVLVCLNVADGKEKWRVDFTERYKTKLPDFGFVSSPLISGEFLYVQVSGSVVKLNKTTGQSIWRTLDEGDGMMASAFSSPMIAKIRGVEQLVVQTRSTLAGVDLQTGKALWSIKIPAFRGMNILNPVVLGDQVFTSAYGAGSYLYEIDKSQTGEWGIVEKWKTKTEGYMSTPAVIDGHVYLHGRDQRFHCLDLKTGDEKWQSNEKFGEYWSMVVQKNQILALDQKGDLLLIRADAAKFDLLDRRRISDNQTWAHLAVVNGEVWIRDLKGLARWDWK